MNERTKAAELPGKQIEIGKEMFAMINPVIGYCPVKVVRDVTDEDWCTTPRIEGERVYEVEYATGDFLGQCTQVAARHLSSSYPTSDASVNVIRVYGFPGSRWITQESDEDDGEPPSPPASTADIDQALRFSEQGAALAVKELVNKFPTGSYLVEVDPTRKTLEPSKPVVVNNSEDYADVSVYVKTGTSEWKFTVSLDKQRGNIYDGEPLFSPSAEQAFDSPKSTPPADVTAAFLVVRRDAVRLLMELEVSQALASTLDRQSNVMRYLDLSSGHVSEETMDWLSEATPARSHCTGITIAPYEYGVFVGVPDDVGNIKDLECADDLKAVLRYARQTGCDVIRFDRDGDTVADLPHFDS